MRKIVVWVWISLLGFGMLGCKQKRYADALTPEEALKSFRLNDDFTVEIFAAEPQVSDPVEMVFDANGDVYVVEMPDYPYKPDSGKAHGQIRKLLDTNRDGRIDKTVVFADSLSEATSLLPYQGGLLVTAAPDILFLKDTNADGRADTKEVLFTGFFANNSEAQITSLRYGLDNWIYASNNGQAGKITSTRNPEKPPLVVNGGDFRFRLDNGQFEVETGPAQFGQTFDTWHHRFMTQNTLYIQQAVVAWRYLHRHPYLPSAKGVKNIGDPDGVMYQLTPPPYWRAERSRHRQEQYDAQGLGRNEYADGHFTGASGGTFYGGQSFPDAYANSIFTGDVAGNLVHRDVLTFLPDSVFYRANGGEAAQKQEFMASEDPWFRPVNFTVGPDGSLYVLDMYRQHIETPVSIPDSLKTDMDFDKGKDKGRIYRIVPKNPNKVATPSANFATLKTADLVALLAFPAQWWRLQAQRLLVERQDKTVLPQLIQLAQSAPQAHTRLHALYTLEGLNALSAPLLKQMLTDTEAGVRENALILAERYPETIDLLIEKTRDPVARVAFQACLSLGQFDTPKTQTVLAEVLQKRIEDPWFRLAVLSSIPGSSVSMGDLLKRQHFFDQPLTAGRKSFLADWVYITMARDGAPGVARLTAWLSGASDEWKKAAWPGIKKYLTKPEHKDKLTPALKQQLLQKTAALPMWNANLKPLLDSLSL